MSRRSIPALSRQPFGVPALVAIGAVTTLVGCGRSEFQGLKQRTVPVTGEVRLDGQPLVGATVVFKPLDASAFKWREQPQATTDTMGKFAVFTYATGDGAPTGEYRVGIAVVGSSTDEGDDQVRRDSGAAKPHPRFGDATTSGLSATVGSSATVLPPFELSSR